MPVNKLILGDNLEILKRIESETIDLIYLDPPFFSNRNYKVVWGDEGEVRSFRDRWTGGIDQYIAWLKERVLEMHRILKPTGNIFLHCDWHADAYIRVEILDKIFGMKNFVNEIVWCYKSGGATEKHFARKHDNIYLYSKTPRRNKFNLTKEKSYMGVGYNTGNKKVTLYDDSDGKGPYTLTNVKDWWEVPMLATSSKERIGYPTQKPEALLQRIIECASNEGDTVLDPFVGGGTTVAVANKLNRKWIGIDQSAQAIKVTEMRLKKQRGLYTICL
jgi:DNA modification methylase